MDPPLVFGVNSNRVQSHGLMFSRCAMFVASTSTYSRRMLQWELLVLHAQRCRILNHQRDLGSAFV